MLNGDQGSTDLLSQAIPARKMLALIFLVNSLDLLSHVKEILPQEAPHILYEKGDTTARMNSY